MVVGDAKTHRIGACTVELSPSEVFAGADMTLRVRVSCSRGCDLWGQGLLIKDERGVVTERVELTGFDGKENETGEFVLKAPLKAGAYTWLGVFPEQEIEGVLHEETSAPFSFTVKPHTTNVAAWGAPSAIVLGERFHLKVGIKCSLGCTLADRPFEIYDHQGARIAVGAVSAEPWPGTTALHFAEVELPAPEAVGYTRWEARFPESDVGIPHEGGSYTFGVTTVSPPECQVTVEAIDEEKQTPIKGALVHLHPFRAFTDERGVAEVRVAKGEYKLFVSGFNYITFSTSVDVTGDMTTRAELAVEPEPTGDEHY